MIWFETPQKVYFATYKKQTLNDYPGLLSQGLKILYTTQSTLTLFF